MNHNQEDITFLSLFGRMAEFFVIFLLLPAFFYLAPPRLPKLPALLLVTLYCYLSLRRQGKIDWRIRYTSQEIKARLRPLAMRCAVVFILLYLLARYLAVDLFVLPKTRPWLWLLIMLLYPLVSAWPQELVYRAFFFNRYGPLFSGWMLAAASAVSFAFLHIIYDNATALALSLAGGILFSWQYQRRGSLFWVGLEHALYGMCVFTVGLGRFFYEGF